MVSTLSMVFLILSFEAFNSPLVFSSSVFIRMFSRLIVDVESLTSSREISKSDLGWCKQTEEHSFVSPNRFLLLFHAINFGGVRFVRISSFAIWVGVSRPKNTHSSRQIVFFFCFMQLISAALDSFAYHRLLPSSKDLCGEKIQRGNSN